VWVQFLVGLCNGVEEAPDVTTLELSVAGFTPFLEDLGDLGCGDGSAVEGADDEVVRFVVGMRAPLERISVDKIGSILLSQHNGLRNLKLVVREQFRFLIFLRCQNPSLTRVPRLNL
jgi:hypothetical protein